MNTVDSVANEILVGLDHGTITLSATLRSVGQEWARPNASCDPHDDVVAMRTPSGWLVLCNVLLNEATGELTRTPVRYSEMPVMS